MNTIDELAVLSDELDAVITQHEALVRKASFSTAVDKKVVRELMRSLTELFNSKAVVTEALFDAYSVKTTKSA